MWKIREHWLSFTRWLNKGILLKESIAGEDRNNFKFIRLAAALLVVEGHTRRLFHREADIDSNIQFHILYLGLPTFFFLSGLLVAQSLEKSSSWKQFVWKRILRLYPAPCLSILCCACIMGPILTTLPLKSYLTSPMLYQYLAGCSIIKIFYRLPGVFEHSVNGSQGVNNSLWSLTLEWKLYAGLLIVSLIRVPYKRILLVILILSLIFCGYFFYQPASDLIRKLAGSHFRLFPNVSLTPLFLIGVLCHIYKRSLVIRNYWIVIILVCFALSLYFQIFRLTYFCLLPAFILLAASRGTSWVRKITPGPDLSYGIFVFGFPVQQLISNYIRPGHIWTFYFLAVLFVLPLAFLSWYGVEKRALRWKGLVR